MSAFLPKDWSEPILRNAVEIYFGIVGVLAIPWWKVFAKSGRRLEREFVSLVDFLGLCQLWIISPVSLLLSCAAANLIQLPIVVLGILFEISVLILLARDGHARFFARPTYICLIVRFLPVAFFTAKVVIDKIY